MNDRSARPVPLSLVLGVALALAASACRPAPAVEAPAAAAEGGGGAGGAAAPAADAPAAEAAPPPPAPITVAAVLLFDNRDRCLRVARQGAAIIESWNEGAPSSEPPGFAEQLKNEAGQELAAAKAVSDEVARLYRELQTRRDPADAESLAALSGMHRSQQRICDQVLVAAASVSRYESRITPHVSEFDEAAARLDLVYRPTPQDRQYVARAYDARIRQAIANQRYLGDGAAEFGLAADDAGFAEPISPEEYRRRQAEWREHQEQLERRRREQEAARRAAVSGWRGDDEREPAEPPRVGLLDPDSPDASRPTPPALTARAFAQPPGGPPGPSPEAAQMAAWHRGYLVGVRAVKEALRAYVESRDAGDAAGKRAACAVVETETDRLLEDRFLLLAPDAAAGDALRAAFGHFRTAARNCLSGRSADEARSFAKADAALGRAAEVLGGYGLAP